MPPQTEERPTLCDRRAEEHHHDQYKRRGAKVRGCMSTGAHGLRICIMYVSICSCRCVFVCFDICRSTRNWLHMQMHVSIRNPSRDHRAARVTEFTPERLHVRTDSISVQVAISVSSTPLNVFAAVSVPISVSIHLEGLGTNYKSRHR